MTDVIDQIRATVLGVLKHHMGLHAKELADLLRYDRGIFALHNRDERLDRMLGELATQVAQGLGDLAELGNASAAWAKADAKCDALIDQSIDMAITHRALLAESGEALREHQPLVHVTARAEAVTLEKQIATIDSLIAFACADVTKREAQMKALAKQIAEIPITPSPPTLDAATTTTKEAS